MANRKLSELTQIVDIATGDQMLVSDISEAEGNKSKYMTFQQMDDRYLAFNPVSVPYGEMYQRDNATATVINTSGVYEKVLNFTEGETNITSYADNSLTLNITAVHIFNISISAIISSNVELEFSVFQNDIEVLKLGKVRDFSSNDSGALTITGLLAATAGDIVDIRVRNNGNTNNVTVTSCNFNTVTI